MEDLQKTVKARKWNWDLSVFTSQGWQSHGTSVQGYPMIYYSCGDTKASNKSLILANVHGDEVTPGYFGFRLVEWLKARPELCKDRFIVVAPMVNPDGFMRYSKGTRTNYNKVDLNRNFDTPDWDKLALKIWKEKFKARRYYPGDKAGTEPEVHFQKWLIDEFMPTKILSIHAPLNFLDYDGPQNNEEIAVFAKKYVEACEELKSAVKKATPALDFYAYGVFPGSLGNYAGKQKGIPTFTVELPTTKPELAGKYFGDLEEGTALFIQYALKEQKTAALPR
ncbi:MAG: M14 family zinc carboxypeptidase [Bdellovibrionales bacterium]